MRIRWDCDQQVSYSGRAIVHTCPTWPKSPIHVSTSAAYSYPQSTHMWLCFLPSMYLALQLKHITCEHAVRVALPPAHVSGTMPMLPAFDAAFCARVCHTCTTQAYAAACHGTLMGLAVVNIPPPSVSHASIPQSRPCLCCGLCRPQQQAHRNGWQADPNAHAYQQSYRLDLCSRLRSRLCKPL
jgi:hypothetical protein